MENAKKIKGLLLEAIFPSTCLACKKDTFHKERGSKWLCETCTHQLKSSFKTICHICGKEVRFSHKKRCSHQPTFLESVSFIFLYENKIARSLIHSLKYRYIKDVLYILDAHLKKERLNLLRIPADILVPLPLYKRKLRERGFNQSELLAEKVLELIQKPLATDVLKKVHSSPSQMKTRRSKDRIKNIKGVFVVKEREAIRGKSVLLIDDVVTTGATLEEAAKTLVEAGAKRVFAFVLARD